MNISHCIQVRNVYPIADSGVTLNCLCMNSPSDYGKQIEPIRALLPDGIKISAHIQCKINMNGIPKKFNGTQELLMSIPVLCDNGCTVTFTKRTVQVHKDGKYYQQATENQPPNCGGFHKIKPAHQLCHD